MSVCLSSLTDAVHPEGSPWILLGLDPGKVQHPDYRSFKKNTDRKEEEINKVAPELRDTHFQTERAGQIAKQMKTDARQSTALGNFRTLEKKRGFYKLQESKNKSHSTDQEEHHTSLSGVV